MRDKLLQEKKARMSRALTIRKKTYTDERGELIPEEKDKIRESHCCHHPEDDEDDIVVEDNKSAEEDKPTQK